MLYFIGMILKRKKKKKQHFFFVFLLSYLVTLIVPLFIGTAFYQRSLRSAETEFSVEILESLSRTSLVVDKSLMEIERLAVKLGINATVNTFLEIEQPYTDQD